MSDGVEDNSGKQWRAVGKILAAPPICAVDRVETQAAELFFFQLLSSFGVTLRKVQAIE